MAKLSLKNREAKREATVKKYAARRAELKAVIGDQTRSMDERMDAMKRLQAQLDGLCARVDAADGQRATCAAVLPRKS